jgi:hypothetical protein
MKRLLPSAMRPIYTGEVDVAEIFLTSLHSLTLKNTNLKNLAFAFFYCCVARRELELFPRGPGGSLAGISLAVASKTEERR